MIKQISEFSPGPHARLTGIIYLSYFITAVLGATLDNPKYQIFSYAFNIISIALYITVSILFYFMFRPVSRYLSLLAAILSLLGCAITAYDIFQIDILNNISPLAFFGPFCILMGYLIFKSRFLPKIIGILMVIAGIGWLTYLSPLEKYLSTYIKITGVSAEASLMLWLIIMGVKIQRWGEQAGTLRTENEEKKRQINEGS